jgi:hypothetical protein
MSLQTIKYSEFNSDKWSLVTQKIRRRHLKILGLLFDDNSDVFIVNNYFNYAVAIGRLEDYFNNPRKYIKDCSVSTLKSSTRAQYLDCLFCVIKQTPTFPTDSCVQYMQYYEKLEKVISREREEHKENKTKYNFIETINHITSINMEKALESLTIVIKLMSLIDIDTNTYGILRLSDLINITIDPTLADKYSYLNMITGQCDILPHCTKNKSHRTFHLPMEFVDFVKQTYSKYPRGSQWLLTKNKYCDKYVSGTLSHQFKKLTGFNYHDIRHQFVTYLHQNSTIDICTKTAFNMGHSFKVAVTKYNDTVHEIIIGSDDGDD